ncbi:hypothetical protein HKBW3S44_00802 [Candidatus Hakubella thermalkaliphila]|uniref:Uncharacterized protein n=1 Tax=Candidatus Hakubella thermalkaliphila TaxID=2754717 RepID=A0A6V8PX13_9ACTN|nr:hypothetical protein [Candidatus Hakubella thermalkaliphila]GFP37122.1 hypothetical protein HKBW3S44_00802 [Candidatus Hakubella thermalkaliphila]
MNGNKLQPLKVGLRAQDIQTSVQDVDLGPLNAETKNIRLIGMAERLAIHIRGADVIDDYKKLEYIASQFGIDSLILPGALKVLEELGWVRVNKKGSAIYKLEESVPYFSDIYSAAGEYFYNSDHSEIEEATIVVCDSLALSPTTDEEIKKKLGLDDRTYKIVLDIGKSGKFIEHYESRITKENVLYSPLYWIENPDKLEHMYALLKKFGANEVYNALKKIRDYQGFPLTENLLRGIYNNLPEDMKIIAEAIRRGIILAPEVDSLKGKKNFAFTPHIGIPIEEKVVLEKAMSILACIRYGEHFGLITRIRYPEAILDRLLSPPYRIGPHTEIRRQYAVLVGRGVGKILQERLTKDRYYFELIPTEENKKAVKLAKDLLKVGELLEDRGLSEQLQRTLFCPGSYQEAMRMLPKIKERAYISAQTQEEILNVLNDTMDGLRGA